ncbi:hypothetical protein KUTeg_007925 [Tegillarca granosa]|uniref:PHD-type domain-containing protein n=1 Tax=Tegillarca granosa TaxID=220873 RepID=A0ABQ9FHL4_TEGGR|nr:hypothetical protein KUTeg_007925 [Tegillarca granosa]
MNESVDTYDMILCPYNSGGHWELIAVLPKAKQLIYMDSFGEKDHKKHIIIKGWKTFINKRFINEALVSNFKNGIDLNTKIHIQTNQMDIIRADIGAILLANSVVDESGLDCRLSFNYITNGKDISIVPSNHNVEEFCRNCTTRYALNDGWVQCNNCNWWCHLGCTQLTVPLEQIKRDSFVFFCKVCDKQASKSKESKQENQAENGYKAEPFVLSKLNNKIKICQGCRNKFRKPITTPFDIVFRHRETSVFYNKNTKKLQTAFGNKYYHVSANCVAAKHGQMNKNNICLPPDLKLNKQHVLYFNLNGIKIEDIINKKLVK